MRDKYPMPGSAVNRREPFSHGDLVDSVNRAIIKLIFDIVARRESALTQRSNFTTRNGRRAQLWALVFLCLTAHALFVSLTHHHAAPHSSATAIVSAGDAGSPSTRDGGGDASCQSCSLQRNFIADTHVAAFTVEHITAAIARETLLDTPRLQRFDSALFGRAPPLV